MSFGKRTAPLPPSCFSPIDWKSILALPLQVGLWIAQVDEGGGPQTQAQEQAAISAFLDNAARKFVNIPMIHQIIKAAQTEWSGIINPLTETGLMTRAAEVLDLMKSQVAPIEYNAYKLLLIEMAEHVARTAPDREAGAYNLMNGPERGWYGLYPALMNKTLRHGRGPQVSPIEKQAINRLIDGLDAGHLVRKWEIGSPDRGAGVRVYDLSDEDSSVNQRTMDTPR